MTREYLKKYIFDWEMVDTVVSGKSPLDSKFFVGEIGNKEIINRFLTGYGLDPGDPITRAELFGNFQEALQFIKRYCLIEGNDDGLDIKIPNSIFMITDIDDLFLMAIKKTSHERDIRIDGLWAEVILKVMHTILHMDKDLRSNYFTTIQTQIFDRFYKFVYRDENNNLFLGSKKGKKSIPLLDFETKSKKSRDSVIIKLLHKVENVAEELFDRVGIRFVTESKFDTLLVVKYLLEQNIVIPHNIKPSRSVNTLVDIGNFRQEYSRLIRKALKENLSENDFVSSVCSFLNNKHEVGNEAQRNVHTSDDYRAIHFTARQLIKHRNPFFSDFLDLRQIVKDSKEENEINKKVLSLDASLISREVKFFYPYEVQILDSESHRMNTDGDASHLVYKKNQLQSVTRRLFGELMEEESLTLKTF